MHLLCMTMGLVVSYLSAPFFHFTKHQNKVIFWLFYDKMFSLHVA